MRRPSRSGFEIQRADDVGAMIVVFKMAKRGIVRWESTCGGGTFRCGVWNHVAIPPQDALEHSLLNGIAADGTLCVLGNVGELEVVQDAGIAEDLKVEKS
jgi:hypothetical protein